MEHRASAACPGLVGRGRLSNWPRPATLGSVRDVVILGSTGSIGTDAVPGGSRRPHRSVPGGRPGRRGLADPAAGSTSARYRSACGGSQSTDNRPGPATCAAEASRRGWAQGGAATAHRRWARSSSRVGGHAVRCRAQRDHGLDRVVSDAGCSRSWTDPRSRQRESLVVGGSLVTQAAKPGQIVAVDSEHSALAQCLRGGAASEVDRLILTASGGPFRGLSREQMRDVTPNQALLPSRPGTWAG